MKKKLPDSNSEPSDFERFEQACKIYDHNADTDVYLMHGFRSTTISKELSGLLFNNDPDYNLIMCDARGHGKNNQGSELDWVGTLKDYENMFEKRNKNVILIGGSMGASEAITLGLRNPKVKKVFAVAGLYNKKLFNDPLKQKIFMDKYGFMPKIEDIENLVYPALPEPNNPCVPDKPCKTDQIYLIHAKGDALIDFDQFEQMKQELQIPDDNVLVFENPTKVKTLTVHWYPNFDSKTIKFIKSKIKEKTKS